MSFNWNLGTHCFGVAAMTEGCCTYQYISTNHFTIPGKVGLCDITLPQKSIFPLSIEFRGKLIQVTNLFAFKVKLLLHRQPGLRFKEIYWNEKLRIAGQSWSSPLPTLFSPDNHTVGLEWRRGLHLC